MQSVVLPRSLPLEVVRMSETLQGVEKEFCFSNAASATWRLTRSNIEGRANTAETAKMPTGYRWDLRPSMCVT